MNDLTFQITTLFDTTRFHLQRFKDQRRDLVRAIKVIPESASSMGFTGLAAQLEIVDAKIEQIEWFATELGKVYAHIPDEARK